MLSLAQRVRTSVALRGWRSTLGRVAQEFRSRPAVDESLDLIALGTSPDGLILPTSETPHLSIVIPVYGNLAYTLACLRSIARHPPSEAFEVIVVDDASPDESIVTLSRIEGIRLKRNTSNVGFVGTCNAGASAARGDFLIFLNNDTQVTPGWAEELLNCFALHPGCGIAGSQLVYPDGRLQEAGAWVFRDASAWNIGRFEPRTDPAVRFARQVDYVSGASLAIRTETFLKLGGFDTRYAPGYYEDTDLAFAVRAAGMSVWYAPNSVVIHAEGISSVGRPETGMKQFQAINRIKFLDKWKGALAKQPAPGTPLVSVARARHRGNLLVADITMPDASRDSGSLRLITMMQLLIRDGWRVIFAPDDGRADEAAIRELGRLGVETIARPWVDGIPSWLAQQAGDLHAAILCRHTVAAQYAPLVRRYAPGARVIFDTVDLHFLREERAAENAGSAPLVRRAAATRKQELRLIAEADVTFVVSEYERDMLTRLQPESRVSLVSNIHEVYGRTTGHAGRRNLLFVGGFGHPPNADAMNWMAKELVPALKAAVPGTDILVAGDVPSRERQLFSDAGLVMLGRVPDLAPLMNSALASIAPLRFGAGVKGKINMAMSHGLPVVGSLIAVEGMNLTDGLDVLVAGDAAGYVAAYQRLREDARLWEALSDRSVEQVKAHFSAETALTALRSALA